MKQTIIRRNPWLLVIATLALFSPLIVHASSSASDDYSNGSSSTSKRYSTQESPEWPDTGDWLALSRSLSTYAALYGPFEPSDYEKKCGPDGIDDYTNPLEIAIGGQGICMQYPSCVNEFCLEPNAGSGSNLPAYTIKAMTEKDVVLGVRFANSNSIEVAVKSSAHSISGASMSKDSILIWLAHYKVDNTITEGFVDSCADNDNSTSHDVIGVSAGQNFNSIAEKVGDSYHFVSASASSVSASGGWIQGGGLSHTSRKYGLGVDNVMDFRVVLPSGNVAVADRCTNADLFWALRGGGGGTFGIVTHMHYKLHPPTPIIHFSFDFASVTNATFAVGDFFKFWVEAAPVVDKRWGGRFSADGMDLFFAGGLSGAKQTFLEEFQGWIEEEYYGYVFSVNDHVKEYSSWSKVLPALESGAAEDYITETSFSRLVPEEVATQQKIQVYQLLESLALSGNLGKANYLLGGNINNIRDTVTSVNPILRESAFLITANQYGYEKMLQMLPNSVSGVDKNHHGALEPDWRQSIWGDNYSRLLDIKLLTDPTKLLNCYQSVGYEGIEVDVYNLGSLTPAPTPITTGTINPDSAASFMGLKVGTFLFAADRKSVV